MQPRLICICGPNGAGKSTYTRTVATMENLLVIDPDKLAADGLSPIAAGKAAAKMARLFLENGVSFARESTLTSHFDFILMSEAKKKGYSGTAMFTRTEPISVTYGIGIEKYDGEGRVITAEFPEYYVVTCYTPNSQSELARLDYRMGWEDAWLSWLKKLEEKKPVIFCGDLNVAHKEIDLKNPKTNRKNAGFTDEEREKFSRLLDAGFIDTYRYFYPDQEGVYSWWSYRFKAREKNAGWRIDYFCVSESLKDHLESASIHTEVLGSDHCPVELNLKE